MNEIITDEFLQAGTQYQVYYCIQHKLIKHFNITAKYIYNYESKTQKKSHESLKKNTLDNYERSYSHDGQCQHFEILQTDINQKSF